jgi:hypothetical protein
LRYDVVIRPGAVHAAIWERLLPAGVDAHALVTGGALSSVRSRLKASSLLYEHVLIESGQMSIQAGPTGSQRWQYQTRPDLPAVWQTPRARNRGQSAPFSVAMAREATPGVSAAGPYHQVLHSETSICWMPTFEPFQSELPARCDWISFGAPGPVASQFERLRDQWKRRDDSNGALQRLVPESFVRSQLTDHVSQDLMVGAAGRWDISLDQLHGRVIGARMAGDANLETHGIALPIIVPRVGDLGWDDVKRIRKLKAIGNLREVLREVEAEAFQVAAAGRDLESAMRAVYLKKLSGACRDVEGIRSIASMALAELVVGAGSGYITGLTLLGPLVGPLAGAGATAAVMTGLHARRIVRGRRQRAWIGVMDAISEAAPL